MKLWNKDLFFTISKNKIPVNNEKHPFSTMIFSAGEYTLVNIPKDILVIDVDNQNSRDILYSAKENGYLNNLVYTYNISTNSFHFYFKNNLNLKLKNKNRYLSIANIEFEYLSDKVVFFKEDYAKSENFLASELPELNILFYPVANLTKEEDMLCKESKNRVLNLVGAIEGSKRSENFYVLTKNLLQRTKSFQKADYSTLYSFYNDFILSDTLKRSEIANNISQIFNETSTSYEKSDTSVMIEALEIFEKTNKDGKIINEYSFSNNLFARAFAKKYHTKNFNGDTYLYYNDKYYILRSKIGEEIEDIFWYLTNKEIDKIKAFIKEQGINFKYVYNSADANEIEKQIKLNSLSPDLPAHHLDLRVNNGVLKFDKETKKYNHIYSPYGYKENIFTHINVNYNPNITENEKIDKFLSDIFKREDKEEEENLIKVFYEILGSSLIDSAILRSAFIFRGKGKNGKSTLLSLIRKVVGKHNSSALSYEHIASGANGGFELSEMKNKKVNITDEMPSVIDADNGLLKTLISGNVVATDIKFQPLAIWNNFATLIFATNHQLKVKKFHYAVSDRLYIIELLNTFSSSSGNEVKNIEEELISCEEDLSYLLNKGLEALERLAANKWNITKTKGNEAQKMEMILDNEPILKWLYDLEYLDENLYIIRDTIAFNENVGGASLSDLFEKFKTWYLENYGSDAKYGLITFKEKLVMAGLNIVRNNNRKEVVK